MNDDQPKALQQKQKQENLTGSGYIQLLQTNRNYRHLWLAQVISLLGDWFSLVAVVAILTHYTGSAGALAGLFIVRLGPMFLLGPFSGVLADRFNRRNLMIVADLSRAITVLGFLLIQSASDVWLVYALTLLQFSLGTLFEPARSALIPAVTRPEERVSANALGALTWSVSIAAGSALGGLVTGLWGTETAFVVDTFSFVGSALMVAGISSAAAQACAGNCGKVQLGADLKDGFGYLRQRPAIFAYTLIKPLGSLSDGAFFSIMAIQAAHVYPLGQNGSITLGLLNLALGVGSGVGPWLGSRLLRRLGETRHNLLKLTSFGFILTGLGYAFFCNTAWLPLAFLGILVGELGGGSRWVFSTTILQLSTGERFRGRVFAVELALFNLGNMIGAVISGLILDQLGLSVPVAGLLIGGIQIIFGLIWLGIYPQLALGGMTAESDVKQELKAA